MSSTSGPARSRRQPLRLKREHGAYRRRCFRSRSTARKLAAARGVRRSNARGVRAPQVLQSRSCQHWQSVCEWRPPEAGGWDRPGWRGRYWERAFRSHGRSAVAAALRSLQAQNAGQGYKRSRAKGSRPGEAEAQVDDEVVGREVAADRRPAGLRDVAPTAAANHPRGTPGCIDPSTSVIRCIYVIIGDEGQFFTLHSLTSCR